MLKKTGATRIDKIQSNPLIDFLFAAGSNLVGVGISALITFVLPKVMGVSEYGYYQLFVLYSGYVSLAHIGTIDGMFLRYGGEYYDKLDRNKFVAFFKTMLLWQSAVGFVIIVYACLFAENLFLIAAIGVYLVLANVQAIFEYIFMATGKIKRYASINLVNKFSYLAFVLVVLLFGNISWKFLVALYLLAQAISMGWSIWNARELLYPFNLHQRFFRKGAEEILNDIPVGIVLLISNVAGSFIVGFVRFSIERCWSIETFGQVSLTLSISNILLVFVGAVARVLFPIVKRKNTADASLLYNRMRKILMLMMFTAMMIYYPARILLQKWLPNYAEGLRYMALLFPICIFTSKNSMLIETYLKSFRKERWILIVNVSMVVMSIITTLIATDWMHNLDVAVFLIVVMLGIRATVLELLLSKVILIHVGKDIIIEWCLVSVFIVANWILGGLMGFFIYTAAVVAYLVLKRNDLQELANIGKRLFI